MASAFDTINLLRDPDAEMIRDGRAVLRRAAIPDSEFLVREIWVEMLRRVSR